MIVIHKSMQIYHVKDSAEKGLDFSKYMVFFLFFFIN